MKYNLDNCLLYNDLTPEDSEKIVAFLPICHEKWMEYLEDFQTHHLFGPLKHQMYLDFLQSPTCTPVGMSDVSKDRLWVPRGVLLLDSTSVVSTTCTGDLRRTFCSYAPRAEEAFRIIAKVHCPFDYTDIKKRLVNVIGLLLWDH